MFLLCLFWVQQMPQYLVTDAGPLCKRAAKLSMAMTQILCRIACASCHSQHPSLISIINMRQWTSVSSNHLFTFDCNPVSYSHWQLTVPSYLQSSFVAINALYFCGLYKWIPTTVYTITCHIKQCTFNPTIQLWQATVRHSLHLHVLNTLTWCCRPH